ncbi:unnamed protein product [Effrenium voratum]|nr:unnamed protein product [Effrenium voratum]
MSFHQCGGNVGDSVSFPIPAWCLDKARSSGLLYKSKSGVISEDCLSLSADHENIFPAKSGTRTALQCYQAKDVNIQALQLVFEVSSGLQNASASAFSRQPV